MCFAEHPLAPISRHQVLQQQSAAQSQVSPLLNQQSLIGNHHHVHTLDHHSTLPLLHYIKSEPSEEAHLFQSLTKDQTKAHFRSVEWGIKRVGKSTPNSMTVFFFQTERSSTQPKPFSSSIQCPLFSSDHITIIICCLSKLRSPFQPPNLPLSSGSVPVSLDCDQL